MTQRQNQPQRAPFSAPDVSKLFDKLPPQAPEAEVATLGSCLLDSHAIGEVAKVLSGAGDFYRAAHGQIYQALVELYDAGKPVDIVPLIQSLRDLDQLEQVGGVEYLMELAQAVPSAASAGYYASIVRAKSRMRCMIDALGRGLQSCYSNGLDEAATLDRVTSDVLKAGEETTVAQEVGTGALLQELYEELEAREGKPRSGISTSLIDFDELTGGVHPGELTILASRPSMGKTALALAIALAIAGAGVPVAFFSMEMSRQQIGQRIFALRSGVSLQRMRHNTLTSEEYNRLALASASASTLPLFIDDSSNITLLGLRSRARGMAQRRHVGAIFVDYLQLMSGQGEENRQQEVSAMARGLKGLARELNVPVVCLSQLNRNPESRDGHRPRMSDLRESGAIEQDADVVMLLHREEYYHPEEWRLDNPDKCGVAEMIVAKQRNGPTGMVRLQFDGPSATFHNLARGMTE